MKKNTKVELVDISKERLDSLAYMGRADFYVLRLVFPPGCGVAVGPYRERRWLFMDKASMGEMVRELNPGEIVESELAWLKA